MPKLVRFSHVFRICRERPLQLRLPEDLMESKDSNERGAAGYIFLWFLGVPAGLLFMIFLLRGCT